EQHKILSDNLQKAAEKIKLLVEERDAALQEVKEQKDKIADLESKLQPSGSAIVEEEEKVADLDGEYASFSRAALINKIYDVESSMVEVASLSFRNAVAQLHVLNPGFEFVEEGLDKEKEVRDGQILPPLLDEEN
ncbi:hypothetical protein A2U01_0040166, partial [Trifolium medium]|nr:hypothetical protein [Trifolium medium]